MTGEWTNFGLDTPRDHTACRSWFGMLLKDDDVLLVAQGWERFSDGEMPKLRVLVKRADGRLRQLMRTRNARSVKLTSQNVAGDLMKVAKQRGLV